MKKNYLQNITGFNKNFVIIGSKNGIDISSYFSMTNGKLSDDELNEFIVVVNLNDYK